MNICIGLALALLTGCPGDDSSGAESGGDTDPTSSSGPSSSGTMTGPTTTPDTETATPGTETVTPGTDPTTTDGTTTDDVTSSTGDTDTDDGSSTTGAAEFTVTSPQFEQDGILPTEHHSAGGNVMPELNWVGAPAETQSFGIFFLDLDNGNFRHSGIWNIDATATGTPLDVEHEPNPASVPGAVQCRSWQPSVFGYGGPGSGDNTYPFTVYALDVDDLSGEIDQNSSLAQVEAALESHAIETTTISAQTEGPP